jgi:hypothetical protein
MIGQQDSTPFGRGVGQITGVGLHGFADFGFLWTGLLSMTLAAALAALIAYHPKRPRTIKSLDEAEVPEALRGAWWTGRSTDS